MDEMEPVKNSVISAVRIICITIAVSAIVGSRSGILDASAKQILLFLCAGVLAGLASYQKIQKEGFTLKVIFTFILFALLMAALPI